MSARLSKVLAAVAAAAAVLGGLALLLHLTGRPPEGPVEVAWDRDVCAECRMHVGDPHFAAQLHAANGDVHHFDDPGCLFRWQDREEHEAHAVYFHHVRADRWLAEADAAFVEVERSPMGYGLGAVERDTPGTVSVEEARARALRPAASLRHARGMR